MTEKNKHNRKTCKPNDLCDPCWDTLMKGLLRDIRRARKKEPNHPFWNSLYSTVDKTIPIVENRPEI